MKEKRILIKDLYLPMGVKTPSAVGHYLSGRREPTLKQIAALADKLDCTLDWLICGKGPKPGDVEKIPKSAPGQELTGLLAVAEMAIKDFECTENFEFTDAEIFDLLYQAVDFAGRQHFSDEFVKQYIIELMRKARNVN